MIYYLIQMDVFSYKKGGTLCLEFNDRFTSEKMARKELKGLEKSHYNINNGYEVLRCNIDAYSTDKCDAFIDENENIEIYDGLYFVKRITL